MPQTILLLGATSDISRALAHRHAQAGDQLILAGRNVAALEKEAQDLRIRYEATVQTSVFDAVLIDTHPVFYQSLSATPDIVYCVFGFLPDQPSAEQDPSLAQQTLMVNFNGAVSILGIVANDFEERKAGTIVGISSVAGERGRASNYFYGSAKAGFTAFLSGLRNRLNKSQVHVLTVKPGFVRTRMTAQMDLPPLITADPDEVASAMLKAIRKKKHILYTKWMWRYIMWIIRNIPERVFMRLTL